MLRYTTDRARPGLVALYDIRPGNGVGQFLQPWSPHGDTARTIIVSHACPLMPARSRSLPSLRSFPTCRQLQLPTSSFIVIIIVNDSTNTIHYSPRPCLSSGWKPSLEQSAARRHISSDSRCFPESTPNLPVLSFVCTLTDTYTLFSGLAVFI